MKKKKNNYIKIDNKIIKKKKKIWFVYNYIK